MPGWDGNGNFVRIYSWVADKLAGINITASRMDDDTNNITGNGFNNCLTRDGQGSATNDLPMNGFRHLDVGNALTRDEYLSMAQFQDGTSTFAIAGGTGDALTIALTPGDNNNQDGMILRVRAPAANTLVNPTAQLGTSPAHMITKLGGQALGVGANGGYVTGQQLLLMFVVVGGGGNWELLNPCQTAQSGAITLTSGTLALATTALVLNLSTYTGYTKFELIVSGYAAGTSPTQQMQFSTDGGTTFITSAYLWATAEFPSTYTYANSGSDTAITLAANTGGAIVADHVIDLWGFNQAVSARVQSRTINGTQAGIATGRHATVSITGLKLLSFAACTGGTYLLVGYK